MLLSFGIVYGAFWFFDRQERAANTATERFPLAEGLRAADADAGAADAAVQGPLHAA